MWGGFHATSKPSNNDKLLLPAIASLTHAGSQNQNTTPETKCKVLWDNLITQSPLHSLHGICKTPQPVGCHLCIYMHLWVVCRMQLHSCMAALLLYGKQAVQGHEPYTPPHQTGPTSWVPVNTCPTQNEHQHPKPLDGLPSLIQGTNQIHLFLWS